MNSLREIYKWPMNTSKDLYIFELQRNANENHMTYHVIATRMARIKSHVRSDDGMCRNWTLTHCPGEWKML
jgi:hypothetical protein